MQVVVWIIIIMLIIFLIWLLRRWIKRLIFILILLALAFFIYGIFNPSGASKLWYNIRTFPQRMASWMGSGEHLLNYNEYKDNLSINDEIGDEEDVLDSEYESENLGLEDEIDYLNSDEGKEGNEIVEKNTRYDVSKGQTIKLFPNSIKFVKFPEMKGENNSEHVGQLTGYSKSDLLGVINKYIEENLDDYTDILVTVEYEDDNEIPQRIILETHPKFGGNGHSLYFSGLSSDELLGFMGEEIKGTQDYDLTNKNSNNQTINKVHSVEKTTSNNLTQKDKKEAEEIFSILF